MMDFEDVAFVHHQVGSVLTSTSATRDCQ
jgi:hypothetical protein